jgi:hypothetical protein
MLKNDLIPLLAQALIRGVSWRAKESADRPKPAGAEGRDAASRGDNWSDTQPGFRVDGDEGCGGHDE